MKTLFDASFEPSSWASQVASFHPHSQIGVVSYPASFVLNAETVAW